ncbi:MAG TPA: riboflavin synthase [Candidatus Omnitrophota bacterium]|nr:riboflavin synthase [Candidatus Omnitrophota bacterium]
MFTGLIQEIGTVAGFIRSGGVYRMDVSSGEISSDLKIGDSVAVNGVCLTVIDVSKGSVSFDVMEETVRRSSFSGLTVGGKVNLEPALKIGDRLGGHMVQGHVDCVGEITKIVNRPEESSMEISIDPSKSHLVVEKGSVAVDGISLTVGEVSDKSFKIYVIPHTRLVTNLGYRKIGDGVNIEFDVVGKYIARSKELEKKGSGVSEELLRRTNFI